MNSGDLISAAVSNTFRSKTRTLLTILSIFIGAFTLAITSGLGTGINAYIDDVVSGVGASDAMTVTKASEDSDGSFGGDDSPAEYDPDAVSSGCASMDCMPTTAAHAASTPPHKAWPLHPGPH